MFACSIIIQVSKVIWSRFLRVSGCLSTRIIDALTLLMTIWAVNTCSPARNEKVCAPSNIRVFYAYVLCHASNHYARCLVACGWVVLIVALSHCRLSYLHITHSFCATSPEMGLLNIKWVRRGTICVESPCARAHTCEKDYDTCEHIHRMLMDIYNL